MTHVSTRVPRAADNPIDHLIQKGLSLADLAVAWSLGSTDNVRKLRAFNHIPRYATAVLMADTFGWSSAGEVMDFWAARVAERKAS